MIDEPSRRQEERIVFVRLLLGRPVLNRLEDGAASRVRGPVDRGVDRRTGVEVLAIALAIVGICRELKILVDAGRAIGMLLIARPGNA